jgi:hypothetical protein
MKVDMSPKAVTERLKTMDELWLLSVKLMNSKKVKSAKNDRDKSSGKNMESRLRNKQIS